MMVHHRLRYKIRSIHVSLFHPHPHPHLHFRFENGRRVFEAAAAIGISLPDCPYLCQCAHDPFYFESSLRMKSIGRASRGGGLWQKHCADLQIRIC